MIEEAARDFLARRTAAAREARDLAILNRNAAVLNREMDDVLSYLSRLRTTSDSPNHEKNA